MTTLPEEILHKSIVFYERNGGMIILPRLYSDETVLTAIQMFDVEAKRISLPYDKIIDVKLEIMCVLFEKTSGPPPFYRGRYFLREGRLQVFYCLDASLSEVVQLEQRYMSEFTPKLTCSTSTLNDFNDAVVLKFIPRYFPGAKIIFYLTFPPFLEESFKFITQSVGALKHNIPRGRMRRGWTFPFYMRLKYEGRDIILSFQHRESEVLCIYLEDFDPTKRIQEKVFLTTEPILWHMHHNHLSKKVNLSSPLWT